MWLTGATEDTGCVSSQHLYQVTLILSSQVGPVLWCSVCDLGQKKGEGQRIKGMKEAMKCRFRQLTRCS